MIKEIESLVNECLIQHEGGERFFDALGNREDEITIGEDGFGDFIVNGGSVSVYVKI